MDVPPNALATIIASIIGAIAMYIVMRTGKSVDSRSSAEAALLASGPEMIRTQAIRIKELTENNDYIWKELRRIDGENSAQFRKLTDEHNDCLRELGNAKWRLDRLEGKA